MGFSAVARRRTGITASTLSRTSENSAQAKFAEFHTSTHFVNKGKTFLSFEVPHASVAAVHYAA
jgi:predicted GNAT family N-acyltransferase